MCATCFALMALFVLQQLFPLITLEDHDDIISLLKRVSNSLSTEDGLRYNSVQYYANMTAFRANNIIVMLVLS